MPPKVTCRLWMLSEAMERPLSPDRSQALPERIDSVEFQQQRLESRASFPCVGSELRHTVTDHGLHQPSQPGKSQLLPLKYEGSCPLEKASLASKAKYGDHGWPVVLLFWWISHIITAIVAAIELSKSSSDNKKDDNYKTFLWQFAVLSAYSHGWKTKMSLIAKGTENKLLYLPSMWIKSYTSNYAWTDFYLKLLNVRKQVARYFGWNSTAQNCLWWCEPGNKKLAPAVITPSTDLVAGCIVRGTGEREWSPVCRITEPVNHCSSHYITWQQTAELLLAIS